MPSHSNTNRSANKRAIGLKYSPESKQDAPKVIAKGFGELAEEIIALAKQNDILVHEDPHLSELLNTLDLGQEIPDSLFHLIAELIAFSYLLQDKKPKGWQMLPDTLSEKV
jgi:flagellar biosynthesis protein